MLKYKIFFFIILSLLFLGCKINKSKLISTYYFNDNTKVDEVKTYKINLRYVIKQTNNESYPEKIKIDSDSATVYGNQDKFYSYSKLTRFYRDGKYFFNFYNDKRAIYGRSDKLSGFEFFNIIEILKYLDDNYESYQVIKGKYTDLIVTLKSNNKMKCDVVNVFINKGKSNFSVKEISFINYSKDKSIKVESNLIIDDFIMNDTLPYASPFFKNFYSESGSEIILNDSLRDIKLTKVF